MGRICLHNFDLGPSYVCMQRMTKKKCEIYRTMIVILICMLDALYGVCLRLGNGRE